MRKKQNWFFSVGLNNQRLSFNFNANYLKVVLDRKLNWNLNIEESSKMAAIALFAKKL